MNRKRSTLSPAILITCEHGGNEVPGAWAHLFDGADTLLASHRGWDPGSLEVAQRIASAIPAPMVFSTTTRLLVDLNRSADHPEVFSSRTASLSQDIRQRLLAEYHAPYHAAVEQIVRDHVQLRIPLIHLSVHSFTPIRHGVRRPMHIAILFDPSRAFEVRVSRAWKELLTGHVRRDRIAFNKPYRGSDDGLTSRMRRVAPDSLYAGVELEIRHDLLRKSASRARHAALAASTFRALVRDLSSRS